MHASMGSGVGSTSWIFRPGREEPQGTVHGTRKKTWSPHPRNALQNTSNLAQAVCTGPRLSVRTGGTAVLTPRDILLACTRPGRPVH